MISRWKLLLLNATGFHTENFKKKKKKKFLRYWHVREGVGCGTLPFNKVGSKLWFVLTFPHSTTFQTKPITSQRRLWDKNMFFLTGSSKDPPEAFFFCICAQLQIWVFFLAIFYSSPDPAEASALLKMSKSASALWLLGSIVSGVASFTLPRLLRKLSVTSAAFVVTTHNTEPMRVHWRMWR